MPSSAQLPASYCSWYNWVGLLEPSITGEPLNETGIYNETSGYSEEIWWCPSDKVSRVLGYAWWGGVSYGINAALYNRPGYPAYAGGAYKDGTKLYSLKRPSDIIYVSEHGKTLDLPPIPHIMYVPVVTHAGPGISTFEDYLPNNYFGAPGNYHPGISNSVFADSHVEPVDFIEMTYRDSISAIDGAGGFWGWDEWPLVSRIPNL